MSRTSQRAAAQAKKHRKSKATLFTHKKFSWLEQVARDRSLPALAPAVCILLSPYFNLSRDGAAWPYQDTLAASLGVRREAVNRVINALAEQGHLEVTSTRGRRKASVYRMVLKATAKCAQESTLSQPKMCAENVRSREEKCAPTRTQTPFKTPGALTEPPGKRERETSAYADEDPVAAGTPPLTRDPAEEAAEEAKQERSSLSAAALPIPRTRSVEREERFGELRAIWNRGHARDNTPEVIAGERQAFERACRDTDPAVILDGARVHVAAADAPRYLPKLHEWLASRKWETPPPPKRRSRAKGQRSNAYAKPDMFKICLEAGGYREDADGNMYWPGDGAGDDEPISTSMWGGGQ